MKKFEVGKRYGMNSACDSDCWWYYTVIERTACTVTLKSDRGEIKKCRINKRDSEYFGAESCNPLGTYSMHPFLTAEKVIEEKPAAGAVVIDDVKVCEFYHEDITEEEPESLDEPKATIIALNPQPKPVKSFVIYQLPAENDATFMDYDFVTEHNIMPKLEDYNMIYRGEVAADATLDDLFRMFNIGKRPEDYKGRSLSVSDVVLMDGQFSYCDSWGWQQVSL